MSNFQVPLKNLLRALASVTEPHVTPQHEIRQYEIRIRLCECHI